MVVDEPDVVAFLDHRPVFKGHTLVVPVMAAVQRVCVAVVDGLGADGSWVSANNIVSQAVPHLHWHVVPRRRKDGLRGFFWPRTKYEDDDEMEATAAKLRAALPSSPGTMSA